MSRCVWLLPIYLVLVPCYYLPAAPRVAPAAPYADAARALEAFIREQVREKELPALSIAWVDDQRIVWAQGFGFADGLNGRVAATADTVYCVGSVSKLFTDLAIMELVERGTIDLDDPVRRHLEDFRPGNRFRVDVTIRHLMTHTSGLVRESPIGSYFDASEPSLERMVESLNQTDLLFQPGTRTQYSNAGIAVLGRLIEVVRKETFGR